MKSATVFIVGLFFSLAVVYELSYDLFNIKSARIYSLVTNLNIPIENGNSTIMPFTSTFDRRYPGIEHTTYILKSEGLLSAKNTSFATVDGKFADSSLFKIFTFEFIEGAPDTALDQPASIVLTENTAIGFFGNKKALGKNVFFEPMTIPLKVTGIVKNIPGNSQIQSDFYISISTFTKILNPELDTHCQELGGITYVLLKHDAEKNQVEQNILAVLQASKKSKIKGAGIDQRLVLKPLRDDMLNTLGRKYNLVCLSIVTFVILLALVKSVSNLTRGVPAALGVSGENDSPKSLILILIGRVLLRTLLAFLIAVLISAATILLSEHLFNFGIEAIFPAFYTAAFIILVFVIVFSIMASIWVALFPVYNPIEIYFSKKKGYGQR